MINHEFLRLWRSNGDFKSGSMVSWKIELRPELGAVGGASTDSMMEDRLDNYRRFGNYDLETTLWELRLGN